MISHVRADGVLVKEADPAALAALNAATTNPGCGHECDGEDPAEYVWKGPGGPSNWYPCGNDARTVREAYQPGGGPLQVELRYSPRCRTAWARETEGWYLRGQSYSSNGTPQATAVDFERRLNYSMMVNDAGLVADACVGKWYAGGGMDWFNCTTRY